MADDTRTRIMGAMKTRIASLTTQLVLQDGNAPDAIQLLPAGEFRAVDGRPTDVEAWVLDAAQAAVVIAQAKSRTNPFVIDYEHQTLRAAENGQPAPASAWFKNMEWREGSGLWTTDVAWTDRARTMIASGEYKFISPVFIYDKSGRVLRLLHAALTNDPALDGMTAVAALAFNFANDPQGHPPTKDTTMTPDLLKLLGLPETATEAEALEALKALVAKLAEAEGGMADLKSKTVPMTAVQELQVKLAALNAQVVARDVDDLVKPALADGRLLPAMEPWARDLGKTNLAALKQYLDNAPAIAALKGTQSDGRAPNNDGAKLTDEEMVACKLLGQSPDEYLAFKAGLKKE